MNEKDIELNILKIKKANLVKELEEIYYKNNDKRISFDLILQTSYFCDYQIGIKNEMTILAKKIDNIDNEIEILSGIRFQAKWNYSKIYLNKLIENGKFKKEEEIRNVSRFLYLVEKKIEEMKES